MRAFLQAASVTKFIFYFLKHLIRIETSARSQHRKGTAVIEAIIKESVNYKQKTFYKLNIVQCTKIKIAARLPLLNTRKDCKNCKKEVQGVACKYKFMSIW